MLNRRINIEPVTLAAYCAKNLEDKHAEDIAVLDLRGMSALADFFIFATAESTRQFRSISEGLRRNCKNNGVKVGSIEGKDSGRWLLVDLFDVIVHVFDQESRAYYDLELLWGDAPRLDWNEFETPAIPQTPAREERVYRTLALPE